MQGLTPTQLGAAVRAHWPSLGCGPLPARALLRMQRSYQLDLQHGAHRMRLTLLHSLLAGGPALTYPRTQRASWRLPH